MGRTQWAWPYTEIGLGCAMVGTHQLLVVKCALEQLQHCVIQQILLQQLALTTDITLASYIHC